MNKNTKTRENRWSKREFSLSERAEELGLELQQDSDGFYWLDNVNQSDMRSLGPFDLDETEDRITAAENGFSTDQAEEYVADQRWKRLHPEAETD